MAPTATLDLALVLWRDRELLAADATACVSWPKKSRPTDVTEDVIREAALPLGPGADKAVWSRLKLVLPEVLR